MDTIVAAYRQANRRLLLLDYDGTLVGFRKSPAAARPTKRLLAVLARLTADARTTVVIVSGREQTSLAEWLGHLPLTLAAEHGQFVKSPGRAWQTATLNTSWKPAVGHALQPSVAAVAGSFVEEKAVALAWHYRAARQPEAAQRELAILQERLQPLIAAHHLQILPGNKILEVRPMGVHKGRVAQTWLAQNNWDFVLAAGDDTTDEDLFRALPPTAYSLKVGPGASTAAMRLPTPAALLDLLEILATV